MRYLLPTLAFIMFNAACLSADMPHQGKPWRLVAIDGHPFNATAILTFLPQNNITGQAPCNRFNARLTTPMPQLKIGPILSTKMACPDLSQEHAFFAALSTMTTSKILEDKMILRSTNGREMQFKHTMQNNKASGL